MAANVNRTSNFTYGYATVLALVLWVSQAATMYWQGAPWYAYVISGAVLLFFAYLWVWVINHYKLSRTNLITLAVVFALIIFGSIVITTLL
ncbi:hypothetical protein BSR29_05370 [Boudabousia liubingyangii]|uniref:Uncharacterized protein n=1 Tax=Boudabousia liubingyangii TaxID=1921764 RepID=A0A1Q5PLI1_9ACTO|nr:hypothetical protein [Boudabousia liubingyangii]OKL47915.1 hypothetical protein BSR29_05370 [Boudabousia liubingyangii]